MSLSWIVLVISGIAILVASALTAALLSPLEVTFDSANRQVRVRWLAILEYLRPFPADHGEGRFSVAGKHIAPREREAGATYRGTEVPAKKSRRGDRRLGRFIVRCLRDSTIRRVLV